MGLVDTLKEELDSKRTSQMPLGELLTATALDVKRKDHRTVRKVNMDMEYHRVEGKKILEKLAIACNLHKNPENFLNDFLSIQTQPSLALVVASQLENQFYENRRIDDFLKGSDYGLKQAKIFLDQYREKHEEMIAQGNNPPVSGVFTILNSPLIYGISARDKDLLKSADKVATFLTYAEYLESIGEIKEAEQFLKKANVKDFLGIRIVSKNKTQNLSLVDRIIDILSPDYTFSYNGQDYSIPFLKQAKLNNYQGSLLRDKENGYFAYHIHPFQKDFPIGIEIQVVDLLSYLKNEGSPESNHVSYDTILLNYREKFTPEFQRLYQERKERILDLVTTPVENSSWR
jgi:hypothetical protein